ncbi:MAG: tRNA (adenosine(37)-N6)-threonylcarbamoyltransferase complex transferase subunit TsaD [Chloroflexi bacterium]|jgi:N6-L-threonylcarbamoyladenine synthase|nr:tRNA (adenosine(37)-N6)-threonylcarbamoyltransferase complex transferase subunit TsaD [Chloroflexota bacterium]MBT3863470.1 tRNA (adenosine(37)-N6)-threonylcarbamoyltransferase complex transferase subunit TsaD [Chloroflexota bacterium]MBT4142264.1 tRNA (adenosine(37)-N6)-threonylcarbamoyltransferase complex transferase subunit TsaD [Chloroflexota bacterium]MBT4342028.1 tRNA (adenosine(37)-N6)-threonylcarbamoyltransferase complex transferase subunit TsaD [Chloroflexota bacterium]MBT5253516.1 
MNILGIETSCDETSIGIVDGDGRVLANVIATQIDLHARYGGIVPEVASRQHVLDIRPVCEQAIEDAGLDWGDIDAVAATHGPGLAGSLIVGLNFSKGLSAALGVPFIGVNHMDGHVYGAWARTEDHDLEPFQELVGEQPIMCLVVSGGHTELVLLEGHGKFRLLGETRDDAAGEAFDKVARVLGLRYPGGPEIQRVAEGAPETDPFPRAWMRGTDEFSFSGLKTAVLTRARELGIYPPNGVDGGADPDVVAGLAKAFQDSVVDVLVTKTTAAAKRENCAGIVLVGGVAANGPLRQTLTDKSPLPVAIPPFKLCTDNGAMIAMSGLVNFRNGRRDDWDLDVIPSLRIGTSALV